MIPPKMKVMVSVVDSIQISLVFLITLPTHAKHILVCDIVQNEMLDIRNN